MKYMASRSVQSLKNRKNDYELIHRLDELGFTVRQIKNMIDFNSHITTLTKIIKTMRLRKELERKLDEQEKIKSTSKAFVHERDGQKTNQCRSGAGDN